MLSALFFLPIILAVAVVIYCLARPFSAKVRFEVVFKIAGIAITLGPVLLFYFAAALAVYGMLGLFGTWLLFKAGIYALKHVGLLSYVESWHVWSLVPEWAPVPAGMLIGGALLVWLNERPMFPSLSRARANSTASKQTPSKNGTVP